ncbi:uncharacterized protein LOC111713720 [Eurytemora carolleeae]|uniref:uncharacterized protein LOC111713720 n=1 Tax=Eurytemora carolleeae TaxID=1294199 RepID=UPI000C765C74|nr:uncharacterized protein LOC111713720 [Eurytemora carolleeae]|eukprot:XP_023344426.1 uncharacterized protein LOC111713720 [Eurytemora affinis]
MTSKRSKFRHNQSLPGRLYQFQVPASNLSSNRSTDPTPSRAGSRSRRRTGYSKAWQDYNGPGPDYPKQRTSSRGVRSGSYSYTPRTSYSDHYTEYSRSRVDNSPSHDEGVWGTRKRHQSVGERTVNQSRHRHCSSVQSTIKMDASSADNSYSQGTN